MDFLKRLLRALPLLVISPFVVAITALVLAVEDACWWVWRIVATKARRSNHSPGGQAAPCHNTATIVIPNWNGRELLEKYLPSVLAAGADEVLVVDNGSEDGSVDFLRARFPEVRVLALPENRGFGGGSNAGFRAASNDIVVLLNSDMRVAPDFLPPLLEGFHDPSVFAVACQIFFSDPNKTREETGLTQGWWQDGALRVRHRIDPAVTDLFPCFYGGGGSCAFDRHKFLELGGFERILEPFYFEDTDLGYMAWKRGWKVLYQPSSVVYHEHRGTIGKRFREEQIQSVLKKNALLFAWKNIHEWRRIFSHLAFAWAGAIVALMFGDVPGRPNLKALARAFVQLPGAVRSRWRARRLARISDTEAFRRPLGGYFRDRFTVEPEAPGSLRVLFVSPYPICPPVHGGGVFMYQTLREMVKLAEVHVVGLLDWSWQAPENEALREFCASAEWLVRPTNAPRETGSLLPHAVREFRNEDFEWLIHRQIYQKRIDVVQLEYTALAQYHADFRRIVTTLFEHDVYFQSIGRGLGHMIGLTDEIKARMEYLRALRYELRILPRFDQVQVCTPVNRDYLLSFLPRLATRLHAGLRAGVDVKGYEFRTDNREPLTMLFVGGFRHEPNRVAMDWFVHQVLPRIVAKQPQARFVIAGADPPPEHTYADYRDNLEMLGYVEDIREPLARYAVFVCPILSGSGVRVKLLEAFAAGIPVVSTRVGAEGLIGKDGELCLVADAPEQFAERVLELFDNPGLTAAMATRARAEVEAHWDTAVITRRLVDSYWRLLETKRRQATSWD